MRAPSCLLAVFVVWLGLSPAAAFEPLDGWLIATEACAGGTGIRGSADTTLVVDRAYPMIGANKAAATHYQVTTADGPKWVAVSCGIHAVRADGSGGTGGSPGGSPGGSGGVDRGCPVLPDLSVGRPQGDHNLLALSWQPGFCETKGPGGPQECRTQTPDRPDATSLALHGLWPQPNGTFYCGLSASQEKAVKDAKRSCLPEVALSARTRTELSRVMPGATSALDRYEWAKHGLCYSTTAEEYFAESVSLVDQINATGVATLFADHIGQELSLARIREAFDAAFGAGAGERVQIGCRKVGDRLLIVDVWVELKGEITPDRPIAELILAAPTVSSRCDGGIVDRAGFE